MFKQDLEYFIVDKNNIQLDKEGFLPTKHILTARYPKKQLKEVKIKLLKLSSKLISTYCQLDSSVNLVQDDITTLYGIYVKQDWIKNKMLSFMDFSMLFSIIKDGVDRIIKQHGLKREELTCRIEPICFEILLLSVDDAKKLDKKINDLV